MNNVEEKENARQDVKNEVRNKSVNDVDYLKRRGTFVLKRKIGPRETKLSLQRKQFISTMFPDGKSSTGKSTMAGTKFPNGRSSNSGVTKVRTPSRTTLCTPACKSTPVCPLTPKLSVNYACVDSKTEAMVNGLEGWLKKRGKPMIFTKLSKVTATFDQASESPFDKHQPDDDGAEIEVGSEKPRRNSLIPGALEDLLQLVKMGFPLQDSEEWLSAIRSSHSDVTSEPLYWECLALLRSAKLTPHVGHSYSQQVDELERKFTSLGISSPAPTSKRTSRIFKEIDLGNVVPSTAINFAVTEKSGKAYVVTPVRRCRRRPAVSQKTTKSSYFDIAPEMREKAVFKPNPLLDF